MATKCTKWPQNVQNGHKIYKMATKYTKWRQNIQIDLKYFQIVIKYPTFFIPRPSKVYPKLDFLCEKIPSGNPANATAQTQTHVFRNAKSSL
jgi:hypothetical protein